MLALFSLAMLGLAASAPVPFVVAYSPCNLNPTIEEEIISSSGLLEIRNLGDNESRLHVLVPIQPLSEDKIIKIWAVGDDGRLVGVLSNQVSPEGLINYEVVPFNEHVLKAPDRGVNLYTYFAYHYGQVSREEPIHLEVIENGRLVYSTKIWIDSSCKPLPPPPTSMMILGDPSRGLGIMIAWLLAYLPIFGSARVIVGVNASRKNVMIATITAPITFLVLWIWPLGGFLTSPNFAPSGSIIFILTPLLGILYFAVIPWVYSRMFKTSFGQGFGVAIAAATILFIVSLLIGVTLS